jgi:hypothetical protein
MIETAVAYLTKEQLTWTLFYIVTELLCRKEMQTIDNILNLLYIIID